MELDYTSKRGGLNDTLYYFIFGGLVHPFDTSPLVIGYSIGNRSKQSRIWINLYMISLTGEVLTGKAYDFIAPYTRGAI